MSLPHGQISEARGPLLWIVVAGGYRTGSTLHYNLIGRYLELTGQGCRVGFGAHHQVWSPHVGIGVVKSHALGGWDWHILQGTAKAVSTYRPTAQVEESMCRFFEIDPKDLHDSFVWREDRQNRELWRVVGTYEQDYKMLTNHPVPALKALVHHLGLVWDQGMAEWTARLCETDTGRDPLSLLHKGHRKSLTS